jgi:3D (Asp-Asp-Asp) domain-containing protein
VKKFAKNLAVILAMPSSVIIWSLAAINIVLCLWYFDLRIVPLWMTQGWPSINNKSIGQHDQSSNIHRDAISSMLKEIALLKLENFEQDDQQADYDPQWTTIRMRVTAYCPCPKCCGRFSDGKTACNHRIRWGDRFVAADKYYGFGTEMIIPGYNNGKAVKVLDRGKDIRGHRLDLFYNTHYTASRYGTKYLDIKIRNR